MKLAALLVEIRRRSRTLPPPHVDPLQTIHQRCQAAPETLENKTLMRIAWAIQDGRDDFDDTLGQEALGLLDALIELPLLGQGQQVGSIATSNGSGRRAL